MSNRAHTRFAITTALAAHPARLALAAGLCLGAASPLMAADPDDLPVSQITLYRSGVGSFVRQGTVEGDADIHLRFRTDQINDILKSMIVLDLDGGRVEGATYGSKEPLSRRLASFAVNIADNPGRAELLNRLRGARVSIRTAEGTTEGSVLGVEYDQVVWPDGQRETQKTVSLVTPEGIWSAGMDEVLSFRILDEDLATELNKALVALAEHRTDNVKTLDIAFRGNGEREVMVGYVHETPVWKTSYRLVLPEGEDDRLTLQGWAIVENTTEEDWEDVRLSLVAGQPISFIMDLYEPLFIQRPEVPVPTGAGARPRSYGGGQSPFANEQESVAYGRATGRSGGRDDKAMMAPAAEMGAFADRSVASMASVNLGKAMGRSVIAAASGQDVGEVFQFTLDDPVTVGRQQSAMLPIIAGDIEGRRVSIFNQADGLAHPMRGVEIANDTGLQLMPGPIAVYDGSAYAGDAQIGHVSRGDERLLAYAVDLDVDVRVENEGRGTVQKLTIVNGMIRQQTIDRNKAEYFFDSNDQFRERTMIVEHPKLGGWTLIDSPEPEEIAGQLYRFEIEIGAGEKGKLSVTQERTRYDSIGLLGFDSRTLMRYSREGKVSDEVVAAFREAHRLQGLVFDSQRTLSELEKERSEIAKDQSRIRQNMGSIDRKSDLYSRYMQKLTTQETRLEDIAESIATTTAERDARQKTLDSYIAGLNVD
ncbi:Putrescine transport ATP-binding protein PotA (TC 3.A.1.11.1) [hydrothermal vent metagenome]|uniref:Putrescine transport ATP-binding protein PotA (TC 3.A.1.11.1) n=1 Tax=hydrothermal vent metagenome TaxID=652676 RepID=A0A3B1DAR4_9ZZZZ